MSIHEKFCFGPDHEEKDQFVEDPKDNRICINPENGKTENWLSVSHCEACDELPEYEYNESEYDYEGYDYSSSYKFTRKAMVRKKVCY